MVGLSRARFYQLLGTAFPLPPLRRGDPKRPYYPPELQQVCLDVRQTKLRHRRQADPVPPAGKGGRTRETEAVEAESRPTTAATGTCWTGCGRWGMAGVTAAEVEKALKELHVSDSALKDKGEVLRAVFLHLKRQDISPTSPTKKGDHHDVA